MVSARPATSTSLCPTPTVSTSDHVAAGGVEDAQRLRRRPRQAAEVAAGTHRADVDVLGRARGRRIRTRSPSSAPPENGEDGSTASTPTRLPARRSAATSALVEVDLPTPGEPVMPMTWAVPGVRRQRRPSPRAAAARRPRPARSAAPPRRASPARARATRSGTAGLPRVTRAQRSQQRARGRSGRRPGRRRRTARRRRRRHRGAGARGRGAARSGRRTCRPGGRGRSRRR